MASSKQEEHRAPRRPYLPSEEWETPQAPVRDDEALGPTEDLDRDLDGVPHSVIGLTAFFTVVVAMLIAFMFLSGTTAGHVTAVALAVLVIPVIVSTLRKKAARERDHLHPSR
jgi:hypothetical protein